MMDAIFSNWFFQFFVTGVLVNYVARKKVGDWVMGIIKRSDRRTVIWNHYVKSDGHNGEVLDCSNQACARL